MVPLILDNLRVRSVHACQPASAVSGTTAGTIFGPSKNATTIEVIHGRRTRGNLARRGRSALLEDAGSCVGTNSFDLPRPKEDLLKGLMDPRLRELLFRAVYLRSNLLGDDSENVYRRDKNCSVSGSRSDVGNHLARVWHD